MSLVTIRFAIWVALFLIVYYIVPKCHQWRVILIGNIVFLWMAGPASLVASLLIAVVAYITGLLLDYNQNKLQKDKKKIATDAVNRKEQIRVLKKKRQCANTAILLICVLLVSGFWVLYKSGCIVWFTPLAISYYSFVAISYVTDVCQSKFTAEKNFFHFYTFLAYFPQLVEGPFSRYDVLREKLMSGHIFCMSIFSEGILRMLYGYVKKLLLADTLLMVISPMLESEPGNAYYNVLLIILLPLQQYADFSGCMDIVLGLSRTMGISLTENFRSPIFSKSIEEVWRRWHITLGAFCKDYIFYPVALNKRIVAIGKKIEKRFPKWGRLFPTQCALIAVWTFIGLWHGFAWKYLLWGWMNLAIIMLTVMLKGKYASIRRWLHITDKSQPWSIFCIIRTYLLFGLMEFVADVSSAGVALRGMRSFFLRSAWGTEQVASALQLVLEGKWWLIIGITLLVLALDILKENKINIYSYVQSQPICLRMMLYIGLFYLILLFSYSNIDINAGFAYANF